MKKKIFNSLSALAIVGFMALNAHVVFSDQAPNFLKWDVIGSILANGDSGSLGNCPGGSCTHTTYFNGEPTNGCSACCPEGKSPDCSSLGCTCR